MGKIYHSISNNIPTKTKDFTKSNNITIKTIEENDTKNLIEECFFKVKDMKEILDKK